jgi:peptide deformylase
VLRTRSEAVEATAPETRALVDDLFDTVAEAGGIGLAANQIGSTARVLVADLSRVVVGGPRLAVVNPEVVRTGEPVRGEDGCLSFPGLYVQVERPEDVHLRYETVEGTSEEIRTSGLLARVLLHELDHLNGVLFVDGLSSARRVLVAARLKQFTRRQRRGETA